MYRSDLDSIFSEAIELPTRLPYKSLFANRTTNSARTFYDQNWPGSPMLRVCQSSGEYWNTVIEWAERFNRVLLISRGVKGVYVTLSDLFGLASLGIQSVKERAACFPFHVTSNDSQPYDKFKLGCRARVEDGSRFVHFRNQDVWPDKHTIGDKREWVPTCRPYSLTPWKNITYSTENIKYYTPGEKTNLVSIKGNNQYFRITDLDSFLGVTLTPRSNEPMGEVSMTEYNGNVRYSIYTPTPDGSSATFYVVTSIPQESCYSYADAEPDKTITARIFLTDDKGNRQEIFTETIRHIGFLFHVYGLSTIRKTDNKGSYIASVHKPSGVLLFFTPSVYLKWNQLDRDNKRAEAWELLKSFPYTGPMVDNVEAAIGAKTQVPGHAFPVFDVSKSSSIVVLKEGHQYSLSVALDKLYTPLQLTAIPTIQSRFYPTPIKIYE